jgi:large subunit ribosomal protein L18
MKKLSRNKLRLQRKRRVSAKAKGTESVPRLAIFRSLTGIWVQILNDESGKTLVAANTKEAKVKNDLAGAKKVGALLAKKCLEKKIEKIVFDRAGYKYHGKVQALAEGAREGGLKF